MYFGGVVENAIKAVGDYSFMLEIVSSLAIMMTTISRFMADFIPWTSAVYGMFEIDDSFACTSSIMPQKKNPFTAETIRATAGAVAGGLAQGLNVTKGIPMGFNFDLLCFGGWSLEHIEQTRKTMQVLKGLLGTMIVNKQAMARHACEGFSNATELADWLVRNRGMSFRTAHGVLALAVRLSIEAGKAAITAAEINQAARMHLSKELGLTEEELGASPAQIVSGRVSAGSSSPKEVERMVRQRRLKIAEVRQWLHDETAKIMGCQDDLDRQIRRQFDL